MVMPIEKIVVEDGECITSTSKRLSREDYWCRELRTVYPYGLNDNVKKVGNISKIRYNLIIWSLFKYRKRSPTVSKRHNKRIDIEKDIETLLQNYRTPVF